LPQVFEIGKLIEANPFSNDRFYPGIVKSYDGSESFLYFGFNISKFIKWQNTNRIVLESMLEVEVVHTLAFS
jgi:hypothetical protein